MKVSDITTDTIREYAGIGEDEDEELLAAILASAKDKAMGFTGRTLEELDEHDSIAIAVLILCNDGYLFRYSQSQPKINPAAAYTLGMFSKNLI